MKGYFPSEREISATEKLLQTIRGAPSSGGQGEESAGPWSTGPRYRPSFAERMRRPRQRYCVGVDFGRTEMRLVKVGQIADRQWQVLAWENFPYTGSELAQNRSLPDYLGSKIQEFASPMSNVDLWASVPPTHLDIRLLKIPKVPRKQVHSAIRWMAKKEAALDLQENLLDFEIHGEIIDKGVTKLAVLAYTIPKEEVKRVRDLFERSGLRLTGVSAAPFALQNLFKTCWPPVKDQVFATLYIGNDHSRIDIFKGNRLVFTRGIKAGVKSMQDAVWDVLSEQVTAPTFYTLDELSAPSILEDEHSEKRERSNALLLNILSGSLNHVDSELGFSVTEKDALRMIGPPLERIIRQVEMTFKHFTSANPDQVVAEILVHSSVVIGQSVISMIGEQLGVASKALDPLSACTMLTTPMAGAPSLSQSGALTTALGLALSDNSRTPNFLFTPEDREEQAKVARINSTIFAVFLISILVCSGVFLYQKELTKRKEQAIAELNNTFQSSPVVNETLIAQLVGKVQQQQQFLKDRTASLAGIALLGELSQMTPSNVRLLSITVNLKGTEGKGKERTLLMEGIARGDPQAAESSLAGLVKKLSGSPLLRNPEVQSSSLKSFQGEGDVLHFVLKLEVR